MDNKSENDFHGLYEPNLNKTLFMASSALLMIVCLLLCYSIIWYEKYGLDAKRTLINQLYSLQWWTGIEFILMVTLPEWFRFISGPLPELPCLMHLFVAYSIFGKFLILQTGLIVIRYIWIFWLKNPLAFKDDFWCCFINIWSNVFTAWPHFVFVFLPGRQQISYYICIGCNPSKNSQQEQKTDYAAYIILFGSLVAHILMSGRIFLYKHKIKPRSGTITKNGGLLTAVENKYLSNFITLTSGLVVTVVFSFLLIKYSSIEPINYNRFPQYMLVYWIQMINAPLSLVLLAILSYAKNLQMRTVMLRETKDFFRNLK